MSNTFWAVFFGSAVGNLAVVLTMSVWDDYQSRKRSQRLHDLLDHLEDLGDEDLD